ncbi:hypothetical protein RHGRI_017873 [Rhododendron griersonianum]|uniref:C2H2-type domain-containing protein n=1 Tax=Rhododendron griersonianum TaxID=479676 RepID=A0AAV6JZH3_9ERIC|nr:hypothetical protein RHGRI_017873 [Rhododendron griersonianum]
MGRGPRGLPTGSLTYEWVKAIHHLNGIQPEGSHVGEGDKCSGPCANGYSCPPSCKDLAKEFKKMHVYCHDYSDCYSNNCGIIYRQTMEQEQVTSGERKSRFDFSYVDTWFVTFTFQRYPETVENSPQKSSSAPLPVYLFFPFILGFQGLVFYFDCYSHETLGLSIFDSPRAIIAPSYDKLTSTDRDRNPMEITQSSVSEMMNVTGSVNELDLNLSIEILEQIHHPRRRRFMHKGAYLRASDPYQGISQSQFVVNLVINTKKGKDILLHESAIVCIGTI